MSFPAERRTELYSIERLEHHDGKIKRRSEVVGAFPAAVEFVSFIAADLLEQSGDWAVQGARQIRLEIIAPLSDSSIINLPTWHSD